MSALRRACIHLRNRCLSSGAVRICPVKSEIGSLCLDYNIAEFTQSQQKRSFHENTSSASRFVCSLAAGKSSRNGDELMGESVEDEFEVLSGERKFPKTAAPPELAAVMYSVPIKDVNRVLDEWVEAGNRVTTADVSITVLFLHKYRLFAYVLQLYEWLESRWEFKFTENDYSCHVDSIAKVQGSFKAEEYIQRIPESFRTEAVYISLLRNYVSAANVYKSEKLFYKMKDLFPLTVATCDLMLYLYKRMDWKKITNIMSFMEIERINPSYTTYQIFIEVEGHFGSIGGMEQVFEAMKCKGMEPRLPLRASMAQYYADARLKDDAEIVLKDMEGGDLVKNRAACCFLLPVFASLGREDEVGRIWRECEASNPTRDECIAAMEAWGKLKRVKDAEAAFENLSKILERPSTTYYSLMLNVYADNKMVTEGEDLFNRMKKLGINIHMKAWDALLNLYTGAGEVEKADAVLEEALQQGKGKPMYTSFLNIFEAYAARGDVQNSEKIFFEMRKAGYVRTPRSYATLLSAYINAKAPDDRIEERMRRDGIVPGNKLTRLLAQVAAFRTSRY